MSSNPVQPQKRTQAFLSAVAALPGKARRLPSAIRRWPRWIRWTALGVIVVLIAGGAFGIYKVSQAKAASAATPALQTATARQGDLTIMASGTGTLIASDSVNLSFKSSGNVTAINVNIGDQVKAGDVLAQLDTTDLAIQLVKAKQTLLELTSASAIATAQSTVATDQQTLYNAQVALNNLLYANKNAAAIENAQAALVLAQDNLSNAQERYSQVSGDPTTDAAKANAYQQLYSAQLSYKSAVASYNATTGKPNQATVDLKTAALALAKAKLAEDQTLLAALTGGTVPDNATGSGYEALLTARQNVETAQADLDAATMVAPISGTVMAMNGKVGESAGTGTFITIADLSKADVQIYMDVSDWSNLKVGYTADVVFDALPNQTFTGKVTQVSPSLLASGGSSVVEGLVELDQAADGSSASAAESLPLGVSASVDVISAQAKNAILVPVQALHQLSTDSYAVFVMVNGSPKLTVVTVGLQSDTFAEIKSGLKAGDVVTTGIQATTK